MWRRMKRFISIKQKVAKQHKSRVLLLNQWKYNKHPKFFYKLWRVDIFSIKYLVKLFNTRNNVQIVYDFLVIEGDERYQNSLFANNQIVNIYVHYFHFKILIKINFHILQAKIRSKITEIEKYIKNLLKKA